MGRGGSIFITKFSSTGQLIYSSYFGGGLNSPRVALDPSTNAYLTGLVSFGGLIPATPGAFQEQRGAEEDAFVAKVVALCALSTVESLGNDLFACKRQHGGLTGADHCRHNRCNSSEVDAGLS